MKVATAILGLPLAALLGIAQAGDTPVAPTEAVGTTHVSVLTADQVVQILDETVDWYRTLGTQQQTASQPSDLLMLYANRQTADQVVSLAFELARANAELLSSEASSAPPSADENVSPQALDQQQKRLAAQRQALQQEMDATRQQLTTGKGAKADLTAKLSELQGELDMLNARRNLLDTMVQFVSERDARAASANALKAHIDAIAVSIPAAALPASAPASASGGTSPATPATQTAVPLTSGGGTGDRLGIWDLTANVLRLGSKISTIEAIDRRTAALAKIFTDIRSSPIERLQALTRQGDALAAQADHAGNTELKAVRDQFDTLAWLFKQTSAILIPLSKEGVLLNQYRHNLNSWRDTIRRQYHDAWVALGIRLAVLAGLLALVFAGAELWRRVVVHYAHEPRRRYQLLLLRKLTMWTLVTAIVALTFVTELSSFATFAGLITAGVAVAMQSVLVSIVGYFFLIGKYGIRVGDRVQIGTVTGEVIDLGLVRMHLMELNSQGPLGATGRVVAFANSIVFQASGGLFKQIPGVNFIWRETTLKLPADSDYGQMKERLLAAVSKVVHDYQDDITRQTREIERTTASGSAGDGRPQVQLNFLASGVEAVVRYPVPAQRAAEIDERVSRELLNVISGGAEAAANHD
ncbi:MAG TPA: mechanosensitive ion channel domain-containing protein [Steroidobacteraceae bacterium]|nr:mechanosensitive ion channel domain-containing protein [Steroidobacteraceae bacterium]